MLASRNRSWVVKCFASAMKCYNRICLTVLPVLLLSSNYSLFTLLVFNICMLVFLLMCVYSFAKNNDKIITILFLLHSLNLKYLGLYTLKKVGVELNMSSV